MGDRPLNSEQLLKALEIRESCYRLLNWLSDGISNGSVLPSPKRHAGSAKAAAHFISNNVYAAPEELLPHPDDAEVFSAFFGTFLTSTFDVIEKPGTRGMGALNGCNCDVCMRIVQAPHLQPKKLYARDKKRADHLMEQYLSEFAKQSDLTVSQSALETLIRSSDSRRDAAMVTYCHWLVRRLDGECDGPAVLALWRLVSRSDKGGVLRGFTLTVAECQAAESRLMEELAKIAA